MSAFMVSPLHINAIVTARAELVQYGRRRHTSIDLDPLEIAEANRVVRMLAEACRDSINARYPSHEAIELGEYTFTPVRCPPTSDERKFLARVINTCRCYAYQACEADTWEASEAKRYVDAVAESAACALARLLDDSWEPTDANHFAV